MESVIPSTAATLDEPSRTGGRTRVAGIALAAAALFSTTGCLWDPCPTGAVRSQVTVTDGQVHVDSTEGFDASGAFGTLDDTPISKCTSITTLWVRGEVPTLRAFDNLKQLGSAWFFGVRGLSKRVGKSSQRTDGPGETDAHHSR